MSGHLALQAVPAEAQQPQRHAKRAYTMREVCFELSLPRRTFFRLLAAGKLPFVQELQPRLGRMSRYRADYIDRYLAGEWGQPRAFRSHVRQSAASLKPRHFNSLERSAR